MDSARKSGLKSCEKDSLVIVLYHRIITPATLPRYTDRLRLISVALFRVAGCNTGCIADLHH